jgi:WD40 repeat protein
MFQRSNLFFLVGTGNSDEFPVNRVCIWDDHLQKKTAEISTNSRVEQFFVSPDNTLLVANKRKAYLYQISDLKLLKTIDICSYTLKINFTLNDEYLLAHAYLVSDKAGYVTLHNRKGMHCAKAHQSQLDCIAINNSNTQIATCSEAGTVIKLIDVASGRTEDEFRRGSFKKKIRLIQFSSKDRWILSATEGGTLHFFLITQSDPTAYTMWGLLRQRSQTSVKVEEEIESVFLDDNTDEFFVVTKSKFYSGHITENEANIEQCVLLIYKKDPFSPSPKIFKKNKIADDKDSNVVADQCCLGTRGVDRVDNSGTKHRTRRRPRSLSESYPSQV